jgi:hypothetical protein
VAWDKQTEAGKPAPTGQDEVGRLWDVLTMAHWAISRRRGAPDQRLAFQVLRVPPTGRGLRPRPTTLHIVAGPGDDAELVLTIPAPERGLTRRWRGPTPSSRRRGGRPSRGTRTRPRTRGREPRAHSPH